MPTSQSGVFACHSIKTTRPEVTSPNPLPYKAWPAIEDWNRYYALPTIGGLYAPHNPSDKKDMIESLIERFPQLEQCRSRLWPMIEEYYRTHFGSEVNIQNFSVACFSVVATLFFGKASIYELGAVTDWYNMQIPKDDLFSGIHEIGHFYSLSIKRPATTEFKRTSLRIEEILQQVMTNSCDGFWDKFIDLNSKLANCLNKYLILEELRADIYAFYSLPDYREKFIHQIYGEGSEGGKNEDSELFYSLHTVTGGNLYCAWHLTILAEFLNPVNPVRALVDLQEILMAASANTWARKQWFSWFKSWKRLNGWGLVSKKLSEREKPLESSNLNLALNATLSGKSDGTVEVCDFGAQLPLFQESMRQQLWHHYYEKSLRTLTCPFKKQCASCCGFGHYLRNLWESIPKEARGGLTPPSQACLQHDPNLWLRNLLGP
jgi:hypothetical protein